MNEIGGDAACYFDPSDPNGAAAIVAESDCRRQSMAKQGIANAKRFGAGQMLEGYRQAYLRIAGLEAQRKARIKPAKRPCVGFLRRARHPRGQRSSW